MSTHHPSSNGHYKNGESGQDKPEENKPDPLRDPLRRLQEWVDDDSTLDPCPIPSAQELAEYEKVLPGAAGRILELAEKGHKLNTLRSYARLQLHRRLIYLASCIAFVLMSMAVIGMFRAAPWYVVVPFAFCGSIPFILIEIIGVGK